MYKIFLAIFLVYTILPSSSFAAEKNYFLMLKNNKVNVRYGPSSDSPIKFIYKKKFLPVKVIDKKENFRKIIDHKKNSGWIHQIMLKKSKSFIVLKNKILFKEPSYFSKPVAKLSAGRLILSKKCNNEWCRVKTNEYIGWIDIKNLWGI
tara:strand:- start:1626 stop:2072 length:447 start_codon:yes stop_codon:yes gene_type:complete